MKTLRIVELVLDFWDIASMLEFKLSRNNFKVLLHKKNLGLERKSWATNIFCKLF
ncbi:MAG: hypothetical protein MGG11_04760 [Trichodesmium sp. MAG_R03]|nr:hypothetical protein [Trichodesmium sp. MAG_R03]